VRRRILAPPLPLFLLSLFALLEHFPFYMPRPRSNSKEGKEMWKSRNQFFLAQVQVAVILVIAHVSADTR
jgi:hypothetical protein